MTNAGTLKRTYKITHKYEVDMTFTGTMLRFEWTPDVPKKKDIRRKAFQQQYVAATDDFNKELATWLKKPIAVVSEIGLRTIRPATRH